jgi:hypothetical protein
VLAEQIVWKWSVAKHSQSAPRIRSAIETMLLIRSCGDSVLLHIPNELMFLIFEFIVPLHWLELHERASMCSTESNAHRTM